jgi:RNA polymerase sigma-70 factor (ECF subfamily)
MFCAPRVAHASGINVGGVRRVLAMTAIMEREATASPGCYGAPADEMVRGLYADHYPTVARYASRLLCDRQAGEDVAQETLLRAWRNADNLIHEDGAARRWLLRVAHNIAVDKIRARSSRPTEVAESAAVAAAAEGDHADRVVTAAYLRWALAELTAEHRAVLGEVYFNGRTVAEAAVVLQIPAGTVKSRVYYALRILRDRLNEQSAG